MQQECEIGMLFYLFGRENTQASEVDMSKIVNQVRDRTSLT